jgi:iron complex outermembrane receptor protein
MAYLFGSVNKSKIKNDLEIDEGVFTDTKGKREAGSPTYMYGTSVTVEPIPALRIGATAKRTGPRYVYDNNHPVFFGDTTNPAPGNEVREIFPAKVPAYWLVNMDARLNLGYFSKGLDKTYFQLNVYNLFDEVYAGGYGGFSNQPISSSGFYSESSSSGIPFVQIGAPRTISGTLSIEF